MATVWTRFTGTRSSKMAFGMVSEGQGELAHNGWVEALSCVVKIGGVYGFRTGLECTRGRLML